MSFCAIFINLQRIISNIIAMISKHGGNIQGSVFTIKTGGDPHQCDFHTNCDSEALQAQSLQVRSSSVIFDDFYPPHHHPAIILLFPTIKIQIQERHNNLLTVQRQGCCG